MLRELPTTLQRIGVRSHRELLLGAFFSQLVCDRDFSAIANRGVADYFKQELVACFHHRERDYALWILNGCSMTVATGSGGGGAVPEATAQTSSSSMSRMHDDILLQLTVHLILQAMQRCDSWDNMILTSPGTMGSLFWPGMSKRKVKYCPGKKPGMGFRSCAWR